jgi:response regulator of citrate/malate metabolism
MQASVQELVWRKGEERCERSYKQAEQRQAEQRQVEQRQVEQMQAEQRQAEQRQAPDGFRQVSTKREEANAKINERYLVGQATQNPFMSANNYANDIETQMNFLTPQKS